MSQVVRWGVLGYARIARQSVIPAIARADNAELVAIATRDEAKRNDIRAQSGCERVHASYEALLADPDVDAVYIPVPNSFHKPWTLAALRAGKHVLCEKPLALNAQEARDMAHAARTNRRLLMEAFMYRFTERTRRVRDIVASGALGRIRHVNAQFRFFLDRPQAAKLQANLGGGALYDVGCYPVNLLGMITEALPVACHAEAEFDQGVDVHVSALLRYPDGMLATIHCGFNGHRRTAAEIVGTNGALEIPDTFSDNAGQLVLYTDGDRRIIDVGRSDRYRDEVADFSAAILESRAPALSLDESVRNTQVMDMIRAALESPRMGL
jgi:D-xylose 1-dehydrogenase (NADP+, D-xylono-1,5-lactone-forming)